jgi:hypothetical protein
VARGGGFYSDGGLRLVGWVVALANGQARADVGELDAADVVGLASALGNLMRVRLNKAGCLRSGVSQSCMLWLRACQKSISWARLVMYMHKSGSR